MAPSDCWNVLWDSEAEVWVAESDDVPSLASGTDMVEEPVDRLKVAIPEMLAENDVPL